MTNNPTQKSALIPCASVQAGIYTIQVMQDGRREILREGKPWMAAQPNTIVWALIDKILEKL